MFQKFIYILLNLLFTRYIYICKYVFFILSIYLSILKYFNIFLEIIKFFHFFIIKITYLITKFLYYIVLNKRTLTYINFKDI